MNTVDTNIGKSELTAFENNVYVENDFQLFNWLGFNIGLRGSKYVVNIDNIKIEKTTGGNVSDSI